MAKQDKPLTAKSSISEWLKHPIGGDLLRAMLAGGGMDESALRPVRMMALQRMVSLSKGKLSQIMVDDLVAAANGGIVPQVADDDAAKDDDAAASTRPRREVVVVIGLGGMGEAIARRQGAGRQLVLSDFNEEALQRVGSALRGEGFDVTTQHVDVSKRESVSDLARATSALGPIAQVAHTAGLSPAQAPTKAIIAVDLVGVALVLEEFGAVVAPGGAGVVISSMAGHSVPLTPEDADALALTPTDELAELAIVRGQTDPAHAYAFAKRANHLRVQTASIAWGARGARVNSISPGIIATPMGQQELASDHGDVMRVMIATSGTGRIGTAADIADTAAFLLGSTAGFITGTDILVDGGVVAAQRAF